MTRRHLLLLSPCLLLLGAALLVPSVGAQQARSAVNGTWGYAGAPAEGDMIVQRAVEPVVAQLRYDLQSVARERIAESTWLPTRIRIGARASRVQVALTGRERRTFASRVGQPIQVPMRSGQYATLTQTIRSDGALEQVFVAMDGTQRNVYLPGPNRTMLLDVTLESPMLQAPVHFQLPYRRGR